MRTNLQKLRKAAGYKSARAFAEHIGMNVATYTDYEQGRRSFTLEKAWEFADILQVSLDDLAGRDFQPQAESSRPDPRRDELNRCFGKLDAERQNRLISTAHDMEAAMSAGDGAVSRAVQAG